MKYKNLTFQDLTPANFVHLIPGLLPHMFRINPYPEKTPSISLTTLDHIYNNHYQDIRQSCSFNVDFLIIGRISVSPNRCAYPKQGKDKKMITNAVREYVLNECNAPQNVLDPAFFTQHLLVVRNYGRILAKNFGADPEIVELSAYLHDIAAVRNIDALPNHNVLSADIAQNLLQQYGYSSEKTGQVVKCIVSHTSPVQLGNGSAEEVCISNADAMSLISNIPYWLYFVFCVRRLGFDKGKDWLLQRVESNWSALVQPAQDIIKKEYLLAKECLLKL